MWRVFRSKLFRTFLRRYLIILGVSGLLLLVTNIIFLSNTFNRIKDNTHSSMAHAAELLDQNMMDLQELTLIIARDQNLRPYQLNERIAHPYVITQDLELMKVLSVGIDSIGIVYRNTLYPTLNNIIFTDTGMYTPESYVQLIGRNRITLEEFDRWLNQLNKPTLLSSLSDGSGQQPADNQMLLFLVPLDSTGYSNGMMIYKMNYSLLLQQFQHAIDQKSNLLIFDHSNTPIVYRAGDPSLAYSDLVETGRNANMRIPGYLILQETSIKQQFHVVNAIRQSIYYNDYYLALTMSVSIILLSLILGLVLSFHAARKSYQPIQELSRSFTPQPPAILTKDDNDELAQLSIYIKHMRTESIRMSSTMNNQEVLSRNHLLQAVLMGKLNMDNTNESNRVALMEYFDTRQSCNVLVFMFDDFNTTIAKEPLKEQWLMKYVIGNIFENLSGEHGINYALDLAIDNGVVGIISWNDEAAAEWEAHSQEFAAQILKFMQSHYSRSLSCAIGELQPSEELYHSFNAALTLAEYRIFAGKQSIISPSEAAPKSAYRDEDRRQVEGLVSELNVAISSGNPETLCALVYKLEERFIWLEDAASFRLAYSKIVFNLHQFINNIPLVYREAVKYKLDALAEYQPETIHEACGLLLDIASRIQSNLGEPYSEDRLYSTILDFVDQNYMDDNLSLSMVADKLSLTPPYVTRYFKTKYGLPLMQYISKVRIDKAKELLQNSDNTIKQIAEKIGFVDENNFSRAFKKREGNSPSKYRSIYQNRQMEI